jgi:hypothetical protein
MNASTSPARIEANRKNALKSTGPRTVEGKRRSSLNAVKHGALSKAPVLAHVESIDEWQAHREALVEALLPANHLEDILVERIALQSWRLIRVARYEAERLSHQQENVDRDVNDHWLRSRGSLGWSNQSLEEAKFEREAQTHTRRFIEAVNQEELDTVEAETSSWAVHEAGRASGVRDWDELCLPGEEVLCELTEYPWTGWQAWESIQAVSSAAGEEPMALLERARHEAWRRAFDAERKAEEIGRRVASMRVSRLLLGATSLQSITRYEAHLERSLYRALHEYQRLQGLRAGGKVPAPVVVDVDVSGGTCSGA